MSSKATITTFGEAAVAFGVRPQTIGDLAPRLGISPKRVPRNGNAKGLDAADLRRLEKILGPFRSTAVA